MPFERWGSLSVSDHIDATMMVTNVLLYDRLIVPVMTDQPDRNEAEYWESKGWKPELQKGRLKQLGDLAIQRPWNEQRRQLFKNRLEELAREREDARIIDTMGLTRRILAQEQVVERPPGVLGVDVVAAYNSEASLQRDFRLAPARDSLSAQAFLLTRRLAVPKTGNSEHLLVEAVKLSRSADFRAKRSELFDWQEAAITKGRSPEAIVEHIAELTNAYNERVKAAFGDVYWRFAFMICGIGLGFATGGPIGATAAAALSLVQFTVLDRKPAIEAGSTQPVAMFHDMESRLGVKLK